MKRKLFLLILVISLLVSGCCYAPGNERESFIEKWLKLPSVSLGEYKSNKEYTGETEDPSAPTEDTVVIDAPLVNLEEMPDRHDTDFVKVRDYIPDAVVELKYSTSNNFTGKVVYDFTEAYLRYSTVLKLMEVQDELRQQGLRLKIWDSFRPLEAQQMLWNANPDPMYVSNPKTGTNSHSRGNTVDVTLVDAQGKELEMPSGFDEFSSFADRDYSDCTNAAAENAQLLESIMEKHGFVGLESEWWHFSEDKEYSIEEVFDPGEITLWRAMCNEYINMRVEPKVTGAVITTIKDNEQFIVLGFTNGFAFIEYKEDRGYVNADYIERVP